MGRNMVAQFILRLRDLVSPGLRQVQQRLAGLRDAAARIGAIGAVIGAISFMGPIQQAAAFDQRLRDIAVTAGQSGAEVQRSIAEMARQFGDLALATGQRSSGVAEAAGVLIAAGMERGLIASLLPAIARVATATNASITDIATTAFTLSDTLRVAPEQMEAALAAMVVAGKEGRFELRAMAREFPALTAAAAGLGLTGRTAVDSLAAALQVARRGAGSESEAANNLANFLNKLTSPETVRKFAEAGVDLERVLADATARGINPIEAVVQKIREISGGNMFRVGELFGDVQVLNFLRPFLQGVEEYIRIRDLAAGATPGIIDTDARTQLEGLNRQLEVFNEHLSQLGGRVGAAFSRVLVAMTPALAEFNRWLGLLDERMPGLVEAVLAFGGAGVALTAALGAIAVAAPAVVAALGLIKAAVVALTGPVGIAVAAVAGGALLIYRNWEDIADFFEGLWTRIQSIFSAAWDRIRPIVEAITGAAAALQGAGTNPTMSPEAQAERRGRFGARGAAGGFYADPVLPPAQRLQGEIVVRAAPGTEVESTASSDRNMPLTTAPDRGLMLGLP
jgi:TP901 family phage tail tape measure protein